jgi:RNA polymerase primary sigma factor
MVFNRLHHFKQNTAPPSPLRTCPDFQKYLASIQSLQSLDFSSLMRSAKEAHRNLLECKYNLKNSPEDENLKTLLTLAEKSFKEALDPLITHHLLLVANFAKYYASPKIPFMDLIQAANLGLIKGVQAFDYTNAEEESFELYLPQYIHAEIIETFREQTRFSQMLKNGPANLLQRARNKIKKFERKSARIPSKQELAEMMNITHAELDIVLEDNRISTVSLEQVNADFDADVYSDADSDLDPYANADSDSESESDLNAIEEIPIPEYDLEAMMLQRLEIRKLVYLTLKSLTPLQRQVMVRYLGIGKSKKHTMTEATNSEGVSPSRGSQIFNIFIRKLEVKRKSLALKALEN